MKEQSEALIYINKEAKQIRKKHPDKEWKVCISEASAKYRKTHPKD